MLGTPGAGLGLKMKPCVLEGVETTDADPITDGGGKAGNETRNAGTASVDSRAGLEP